MKKQKLYILLISLIILSFLAITISADYYELHYSISYLDEYGAVLSNTVSGTDNYMDPNFKIESPDIPGYRLKNDSDKTITVSNMNITFPSSHYERVCYGEKTVIYVKECKIRVISKYANGTKALVDKVYSIKKGDIFTYEPFNIQGFVCDINYIQTQINDDTTFILTYYPNSYNVTYEYNNGTPNYSDIKMHDIPYTISPSIPYKEGYIFSHYLDGNNIVYPSSILNENRDYTLSAIYSYTNVFISYDGNGGICNIPNQIKEYDVPIYLSTIIPTRAGYSFLGWDENMYANSPSFFPGDIYTQNASLHLYAIWEYNGNQNNNDMNIYEIRYITLSDETSDFTEYKNENESYNISSVIPEKTGYTFSHWIDLSDQNVIYKGGDIYTGNHDLTLQAAYISVIQNTTYTVTYSPSPGTFPIEYETIDSRDIYKIPNIKPTYDGHVFLYWCDDENILDNKYYPNSYYTKCKNVTLYAFYASLDNTYIIHYDANTGDYPPQDTIKKHNEDVQISYQKPTKYGYRFLYWCVNKNGNGEKYYPNDKYTKNSSITLYAIWSKNETTYSITYDLNYGYAGPASQTKIKGIDISLSLIRPKKDGYIFIYWTTLPDGDGDIYYPGDTYSDDNNVVLHANYALDRNIYTITYDANSGYGAPERQIKYENETVYISLDVPSKHNCEFIGWCEDPYSDIPTYYQGDEYSENRSIYLYAIYTEIYADLVLDNVRLSSTYESNDIVGKAYIYNDSINNYSNLDFYIYINGTLYASSTIETTSYETTCVTFNIPVSKLNNSKDVITISINENREIFENDYSNNIQTKILEKNNETSLSINDIRCDDAYIEDEDVYVSYYACNNCNFDILPHNNLQGKCDVYYYDHNGDKMSLYTFVYNNIVIPKGDKNLVFFRFHIPIGYAGKVLFIDTKLECESLNINESSSYSVTVKENTINIPDDTIYEYMPSSYHKTYLDEELSGLSYYIWTYDGNFTKTIYSYYLDPNTNIYPSENTPYYTDEENKVYIKSGYPISISYIPNFSQANLNVNDIIYPTHPLALFPDNMYSFEDGKSCSLEYVGNEYIIPKSKDDIRAYFTQLYTPDGEYSIFVYSGLFKTPGGCFCSVSESNKLYIQSNLYTDWYTGEKT